MKVHRRHQYMEALQEELNKIKVFQSELPLSLHLVNQAIDACRRQIATETTGYQSESEETTCEGSPLLEEFIPIRRNSDDNEEQDHRKEEDKSEAGHDRGNKPDWLRSAQLWNQEPETSPTEAVDSSRKSSSSETKRGASSSPCRRGKKALPATAAVSDPSASAAAEGHDKEGNLQKKARRCWSPELHRRFLHALQQLGGSHAATPKHIKELMKVDGLTNDEIKSHLQKYRLHTRQSSLSTPVSSSPPSQFVLVGGIWVAPQYTAATSCGRAPEVSAATIYTQVEATVTSPSVASTTRSLAQTKKAIASSQQKSPLGALPSGRNGSKKLQRPIEHQSSPSTSSSHTTSSLAL